MACDDFIAAILTGTHQRRLIDSCRLDRLHKPLHFRIVPNTKGVIFERVQVCQIEIDDFLFLGTGSITGRRWLRRDLRTGGSAALIHGRILRGGLALGLFVPRFGRLGLIGSGLAILGWATSAGLGGLILFRGRFLLDRLFLLLGRLITGGGEIHHLASGSRDGIALVRGVRLLALLIGLGRLGSRRAGSLRNGGLRLFHGSRLFSRGGICRNRLGLFGSRRLRRGGRVSLFYLGADILFIVCQCQTSFS